MGSRLVALDGHDPTLTDLGIVIQVSSPSDPERVAAMQRAWEERCPIYLALLNPNSVSLSFR
ncbi:DUF4253 domain-containing protein [Kribbella sp. NBC_01510]|uniref:hypothetical protein n=1 Tax=Kribbella sp. NBC_01510 TaxID=2903581 RepID=UPI00386D4391